VEEVMNCFLKENGFTKETRSTAGSFHTAVGKSTGQQEEKNQSALITTAKDHNQHTSIV